MNDKIYLNNDWSFSSDFSDEMLKLSCKEKFLNVRLPHTVSEIPFNYFNENDFTKTYCYRKKFTTEKKWNNKVVLLTFEGMSPSSVIYLNGNELPHPKCAYVPFTVDVTLYLAGAEKNNVLAVKLNPDFENRCAKNIYRNSPGIFRDVYLELKNKVYIDDISIETKANDFNTRIQLTCDDIELCNNYIIEQKVVSVSDSKSVCAQIVTGINGKIILTSAKALGVSAWSLEHPVLYELVTEIKNEKEKVVDTKVIRFGFRDIAFSNEGFYLNGKKIELRGFPFHQSFPYVGYAMPENIIKEDADLLKELGLNFVIASLYSHSQHFLDRCDETGLLVFTDINELISSEDEKSSVEKIIKYNHFHPSFVLYNSELAKNNSIAKIINSSFACKDVLNEISAKKKNQLLDLFAFDFNVNKSSYFADGVCCNGVMDMFRNPKPIASFFKSQKYVKEDDDVVLDVYTLSDLNNSSYPLQNNLIFTNADKVKFYENDKLVKEFIPSYSSYKNIIHSPIFIDEYIENKFIEFEGFAESDSIKINELFFAINKFGNDKLPLKYKLLKFSLVHVKKISPKTLEALYNKYLNFYYTRQNIYKFEAFSKGRFIKKIVKAVPKKNYLKCDCKRTILYESNSYDVSRVSISAVDENMNVLMNCNDVVTLKTEGEIAIIGNHQVSLKNGTAGVYVKSLGKSGKGKLTICDCPGNECSISFTVKVLK